MLSPPPLVSIVMPSFNQAAFIPLAVESVLSQDYANLELIVADGGSTDGTLAWLAAKQAEDNRLRWFSGADTGPANALNKALGQVRGTVIGWLNSDDLYAQGAVTRAMAALQEHPEWVMVYGHGRHIDAAGSPLDEYPTLPPETPVGKFADGCFICQPTVFFRRPMFVLLGKLDENLQTAFDFDYWLRAFKAFPGRIGFVDALQAHSRLHTECITMSMRRTVALEGMEVVARYLGSAPSHWIISYINEVLSGKAAPESNRDFSEYTQDLLEAAAGFMTSPERERLKNFLAEGISREVSRTQPRNIIRQDALTSKRNKKNHSSLKILLFGNCQTIALEKLLQAMTGGAKTTAFELVKSNVELIESGSRTLGEQIIESDLILFQPEKIFNLFTEKFPHAIPKIRLIPRINFSAFHPDLDYVRHVSGGQIGGELGPYHSILAFYGWKAGLDIDQTVDLFQRDIFQHLGYFDYLQTAKKFLIDQGKFANLPLDGLMQKWLSHGCFMHSMNHPKLYVLADLARAILSRENIEAIPDAENYIEDNFSFDHCWPVYPEIAEYFGMKGHYYFKKGRSSYENNNPVMMINLQEFIQGSFEEFSKHKKSDLSCPRLETERYKSLGLYLENRKQISSGKDPSGTRSTTVQSGNPYKNLPSYQFWRRAIESQKCEDVDPVARARFQLKPQDKIATAGSCFAQHISRTLKENDFNYYIAESGAELSDAERINRQFGVFSARYGNIYTPRQLVQLFERAYGRFQPCDQAWMRADGRYTDPFRPQIEQDGFASLEELEKSRNGHLECVRKMFETLDVFIFTLGLTESWRSKLDGAVFPLAPGVVSGELDSDIYEFVNYKMDEIVADLSMFVESLLAVNPAAKLIFTVSPVPLIATYENRHVLVSTTYSKSTLLAAVDAVVRQYAMCDYFPSYEIITGNYTRGVYYDDDLRSVTTSGVAHVMRLFMKHYTQEGQTQAADTSKLENELTKEAQRISEVICDEESIVSG